MFWFFENSDSLQSYGTSNSDYTELDTSQTNQASSSQIQMSGSDDRHKNEENIAVQRINQQKNGRIFFQIYLFPLSKTNFFYEIEKLCGQKKYKFLTNYSFENQI